MPTLVLFNGQKSSFSSKDWGRELSGRAVRDDDLCLF